MGTNGKKMAAFTLIALLLNIFRWLLSLKMPLIKDIVRELQALAPVTFQEDYDNSGLQTGDRSGSCNGIVVCLDVTPAVVEEAKAKGCNLIVSHHPLIFKPIKSLAIDTLTSATLVSAVENKVAIYSIHTNLDNVLHGVSGRMANLMGLRNLRVLSAKGISYKKLYTFVPVQQVEQVRNAIFNAGAGHIGNYSECSFGVEGEGTFKGGEGSDPFVGEQGKRHSEREVKLEMILPAHLQDQIVSALIAAHPYEEVAYDVVSLDNVDQSVGSGALGDLETPQSASDFLAMLKRRFKLSIIRHSESAKGMIQRVAVCGGAGSFLIPSALRASADAFVTADIKYHDFFDASDMLLCDIGHFESEQFTVDLIAEYLQHKFPTFAVLKTEVVTNPVRYFT